jgi:very-short-patch-repair endonuclease
MQKSVSSIEQKIALLLQKNNIEYTQHKKIGRYFPDFIIHDLVIECDGLFWHSDAVIQDRFYHAKKREFYISNGYRPLFFREDEIYNKINIIESIILNKLGLNQKIYARKCSITEGTREFFTHNHLMGPGRGKIIALTYNNVVVAALQYFKRNNITEIDRFCTLPNISVVGGFSKLVSKLETPISTFIDLRYGSGDYLSTLYFFPDTNYLSFRWCYGSKSYHRFKFKNNTGYEYNYNKIWDCGQAKYIRL